MEKMRRPRAPGAKQGARCATPFAGSAKPRPPSRARRSEATEENGGFTLIELLVVILIVAILAAVAVPVFLKQRQKGYEDQIRSDLKNAALAVETYATETYGSYAGLDELTGPALAAQGFNMPSYLRYIRIEASSTAYCLAARHRYLTGSSAWRRSTYQSSIGNPQPTPDRCPEL